MQVLQRQQQQPAAMYAPVAYTQQQQLPAHPSRSMTYDYSGMQARTSIDGGDRKPFHSCQVNRKSIGVGALTTDRRRLLFFLSFYFILL